MNRNRSIAPLTLLLGLWASACNNPTVDPESTFYVSGTALGTDGKALPNAEVHLVRFFDDLKLLQPTIDDLFRCNSADCGYKDDGLQIALVKSVKTDAAGIFSFEVKGADIAAQGGFVDDQGKVEVSSVVVVAYDPADPLKRAGVLTSDYLFQQADPEWAVGSLQLWSSDATADVAGAATTGLVRFRWKKLDKDVSAKNLYRVDVGGANSARLVVNCREVTGAVNPVLEGGCLLSDGVLSTSISAFSLYSFYSDHGDFNGYVTATGNRYRYRTKFTIPIAIPDPTQNRTPVGIEGIWATTDTANQPLKGTRADDGDLNTRETINSSARFIYVKFLGGSAPVTDAGLLNSLAKDAASACVVVEFNVNLYTTIDIAKAAGTGWEPAGKFCGNTGGPNEMAALMSYDTSQVDGKVAAWMRYRIIADANENPSASPYFQAVGEVAIYRKSN